MYFDCHRFDWFLSDAVHTYALYVLQYWQGVYVCSSDCDQLLAGDGRHGPLRAGRRRSYLRSYQSLRCLPGGRPTINTSQSDEDWARMPGWLGVIVDRIQFCDGESRLIITTLEAHSVYSVWIWLNVVVYKYGIWSQWCLIKVLKKVNFEIYIADRKATTCI